MPRPRLPWPLPLLLALLGLAAAAQPAPARAGAAHCAQCCADSGLYSCPTYLRIFGEGSELRPEGGGYRVTGVWRLDCEQGARFDPTETVVLPEEPRNGQVLLVGYAPTTVRCFRDWCVLPANGCIEERPDGDVRLQRCTDGQPMRASELLRIGTPPPSVYVPPSAAPASTAAAVPTRITPPSPATIPRPATPPAPVVPQPNPGTAALAPPLPTPPAPLVSTPPAGTAPLVRQPNPGTAPAAPRPAAVPPPDNAIDVLSPPPPAAPPDTVVLDPALPEYPPHLPAEGPLHISLAFEMPEPPGERCVTTAVVASEARRRLDMGDEARLRGDNQTAIDEYRAAVTLDRCSAIAWAALGQLALAADDTEKAIVALEVATRLRADHYGALTSLGLAYEARGRMRMAEDAFTRALQVRPGHPAAVEGLARVRTRP